MQNAECRTQNAEGMIQGGVLQKNRLVKLGVLSALCVLPSAFS